jgi:flavin-binding protein dodecin
VHGIKGAWIAEQKVEVEDGAIVEYRVVMRVSFIVDQCVRDR